MRETKWKSTGSTKSTREIQKKNSSFIRKTLYIFGGCCLYWDDAVLRGNAVLTVKTLCIKFVFITITDESQISKILYQYLVLLLFCLFFRFNSCNTFFAHFSFNSCLQVNAFVHLCNTFVLQKWHNLSCFIWLLTASEATYTALHCTVPGVAHTQLQLENKAQSVRVSCNFCCYVPPVSLYLVRNTTCLIICT